MSGSAYVLAMISTIVFLVCVTTVGLVALDIMRDAKLAAAGVDMPALACVENASIQNDDWCEDYLKRMKPEQAK